MKATTMIGALLLSATVCSQGFGIELLSRMRSMGGDCGQCGPAACEKVACDPCCPVKACDPVCDPGCQPACEKACAKKCTPIRDLFCGLKDLCGKKCKSECNQCNPCDPAKAACPEPACNTCDPVKVCDPACATTCAPACEKKCKPLFRCKKSCGCEKKACETACDPCVAVKACDPACEPTCEPACGKSCKPKCGGLLSKLFCKKSCKKSCVAACDPCAPVCGDCNGGAAPAAAPTTAPKTEAAPLPKAPAPKDNSASKMRSIYQASIARN